MVERRVERHALALLPGLAIVTVVVLDLLLGEEVVLGLVAVAPLLAATVVGPRSTAAYGGLAFAAAAVLGVVDDAYLAGDPRVAQLIRLGWVLAMSVAGVLLSRYRIRSAQRLTQVIKVAEAAQRAILLPVPQRLGPARIAVHYESAASESLVGGDMYGMVQTGHGLRVLVGDVRGKGLDAVQLSAQVLAAFRERANDDPDLGVLMHHLDRTVARAAESPEDFVTAVVLQLDAAGRAVVATSGHPAPFRCTGERVELLEVAAPGPPLGLGGGGDSPLLELQLQPGERLLLYTDGLTEARNSRSREFLPPSLISAAVAGAPDVAAAVTRLRREVLAWGGGVLADDLALVMVEFVPQPATGPGGDATRERPGAE